MKLPQTSFMAILPLILLSSITTTITSRPTALITSRRGLSENCDPLFGIGCSEPWPFASSNPFMSRPFLRSQTNSPPSVVVPSPPPPVFTNYPSFTPPLDDTNPSFSPLVASPPPPGYTFTTPTVVPQLPPDNDDDINSPFIGISFSPPNPEVTLPPIVENNQPDQFVSPPQENQPGPPVVPIESKPPEDAGKQLPQLPPVVESPPAA
uniref:proline-rich receptor-like protein kinase PERK13 n=1 Tax=Erigeron canadensis TaxID=72917 RepID=UPI001CB9CBE6|nr:proline-rich receptor-like protein kinase PERK13 [Erigeron canadensis]